MDPRYQELLKYNDILWRMCGHHPLHFYQPIVIASLGLTCYTLILTIVQIFEFFQSMDTADLHTISVSLHSALNLLVLLVHQEMMILKRKKLVDYLAQMQHFWKITNAMDPALDRGLRRMQIFSAFLAGYYSTMAVTLIIFGFFGYLVFPCYAPTFFNIHVFNFLNNLTFYFFACVVTANYIFVFDHLYLLKIQFVMLNDALGALDFSREDESLLEELKAYQDHHNFLLRCCRNYSDIVGFKLFYYFLIVTIILSADASTLVFPGTFGSKLPSLCFLTGYSFQLFCLCCRPAQLLTDESERVAESIYLSNWYCCRNIKTRKILLFMMKRSQEPVTIDYRVTLITINNELFRKTMNTAYSFCMFLLNMRQI